MTLFSTIVAILYIFLDFLYFLGNHFCNICIRPISKIHVVKSICLALHLWTPKIDIFCVDKDAQTDGVWVAARGKKLQWQNATVSKQAKKNWECVAKTFLLFILRLMGLQDPCDQVCFPRA